MRVSVEGWRRNHGQIELFTGRLSAARVDREITAYSHDEIQIEARSPSDDSAPEMVTISKRITVRLTGDYLMKVKLSKTDVAFLAWVLFIKSPLNNLVRLFAHFEEIERETA